MQVSITGRHVDLTEPLKDYVHDKLGHLKHSFDHVVDVHVVLGVEKHRHRCEVTMAANGVNIHAKHETDDMYAAIDGVIDKINRQLKRYRQKLQRHQGAKQRNGRQIKVTQKVVDLSHDHEELAVDHAHATVDHKEVTTSPMTVDEAIMQMELAEDLNVLFFTNSETDTLNALYRRSDGSLNLVETE